MSSGSPNRVSEVLPAMLSSPTALTVARIMRDMNGPGQMQLEVMCLGPRAPARCFDNITTAALLALYAKVSISGGCKPFTEEM
mmetsp:Transcript_74919/g.92069  ORF Transcript_74919/g.92069 Transcript_74919/m.92069 type:complete len:83 (+) Transcript_74919:221-469(+)